MDGSGRDCRTEGQVTEQSQTTPSTDREKVMAKLEMWPVRKLSPCKQWRGTGYFDVPDAILRTLEAEGIIESRKQSGSSPTEWRRA